MKLGLLRSLSLHMVPTVLAAILVVSVSLTGCGSDKGNGTTASGVTTASTPGSKPAPPAGSEAVAPHQPPGGAPGAAPSRQGIIPTPTVDSAMSHVAKTPQPPPFQLIRASASTAEQVIPEVEKQPVAEFWQARGEPGEFGGTFTVGAFGQGPKTFNKWQAADVESDGICQLMYEDLLAPDPWTGQYYPKLARSFTISPDKKESPSFYAKA